MFPTDRHKSSFSMSDEFIGLVDTLHKSVCGSTPVSLFGFTLSRIWVQIKVVEFRGGLQCVYLHTVYVCLCRRCNQMGTWFWKLCYFCGVR